MKSGRLLLDSFIPPFQQIGHKSRPSGLVGGTQPQAGFSVKVLVKEEQVPPVRISLEGAIYLESRAKSLAIPAKDIDKPFRDFIRRLPQSHPLASQGRGRNGEAVREVSMDLLQSPYQKIVQGKPDGSAPVGIAAEEPRLGFPRFITDHGPAEPRYLSQVLFGCMHLAHTAHAVKGTKFLRVEHPLHNVWDIGGKGQGKETFSPGIFGMRAGADNAPVVFPSCMAPEESLVTG